MQSSVIAIAYDATMRRGRLVESTLNSTAIIMALLVNWVLLLTGLTRSYGIYTVLLYVLLLYALESGGIALLDAHQRQLARGTTAPPPPHAPANSEIRPFIVIFLAWWAISQAFFEAHIGYDIAWPQTLLLMLIVFASSLLPLEFSAYAARLFPLAFLVALGLPSHCWMPQHARALLSVLRVFCFFVAVFVADFAVARRVTREYQLAEGLLKPQTLVAAAAEAYSEAMLECDLAYADERLRTLRIIAQCAWILVVPPAVIVIGALVLGIGHGIQMLLARHNASKFAALEVQARQYGDSVQRAASLDPGKGARISQSTSATRTNDSVAIEIDRVPPPPPSHLPPPPPSSQVQSQQPQQQQPSQRADSAEDRHRPPPRRHRRRYDDYDRDNRYDDNDDEDDDDNDDSDEQSGEYDDRRYNDRRNSAGRQGAPNHNYRYDNNTNAHPFDHMAGRQHPQPPPLPPPPPSPPTPAAVAPPQPLSPPPPPPPKAPPSRSGAGDNSRPSKLRL